MSSYSSSTYYETLSVADDAHLKDIKHSYRELVLKYHPDRQLLSKKQNMKHKKYEKESTPMMNNNNTHFLGIQEAWEILRDVEKRRIYDLQLKKEKEKAICIAFDVDIDDCEMIDEHLYEYECRCGDYFHIETDIKHREDTDHNIVVSCHTCCLNLRLSTV